MMFSTEWPQFYTATILNRQPLLSNNKYNDIIIESLQYCVKENKEKLYAFVIMSNHIHLVWQPLHAVTKAKLQHHFMTFSKDKRRSVPAGFSQSHTLSEKLLSVKPRCIEDLPK